MSLKGKLVKIHHINVEFPYDPYPCQVDYMTKVIESLDTCSDAALESPTGTGKTLSLLCATLGWIKERKNRLGPSIQMAMDPTKPFLPVNLIPRIFYCSRTHSQLSQVVRELNKTNYKDVKVCTLGSRDQLCVHETVSKERDAKTKALKCRNLVAKRTCHYYNQWNGMDLQTLDMMYGQEKKVLDIEDLAKTAKGHKQCPFYRSRQLQETAELILLPYNYLIDPHLRQMHKIDLKGNIVIFDEAHNLEGVCEESVSTHISTADVAFLIKELQKGLEALHTRNEEIRSEMDESNIVFGEGMDKNKKKEKQINLASVADVLEKVFELEKKMDELWQSEATEKIEMDEENKVFPGGAMVDMLEKAGFRKENVVDYADIIHSVAMFLAEEKEGEEGQVKIKDLGHKLLDFGSFLSRVFADSFEAVSKRGVTDKDVAGANFKLFVVKDNKTITFNYWCMTAGIAMRFLKSRGVLSMIITSGTLAPIDQFTKNLGIPFPHTLQNAHAAKSDQVSVIIAPKGRDGVPLSGTFQNRTTHSYLQGVGDGIAKTVENTPHGVLIFFSSYSIMNSCIDKWKDKGTAAISIYDRIRRKKEIVIEPKNKTELAQVRFNFDNAVKTKGGAVFFAVCRGKVSEGIDFADTHSRAVIIVGIPYPPVFEPRVKLKRSFLDECNKKDKEMMSGSVWYAMEGYRAVNQAIGRVLRHVNDYGVVVLLDSRFNSTPVSSFPRWVQNSFDRVKDVSEIESSLKKFFRKHGGAVKGGGIITSEAVSSSATDKRSRSIIILGNGKNTMDPQGIRDIASEYTSAPIIIDLEEPRVEVSKGFLNRALLSVPSTPSSSPSTSSSTIVKRPLPTSLTPVLDPSTVATAPSQQSIVKKRKIGTNTRIGETKETKENEGEKKMSEFANMSVEQFKKMMKDAELFAPFQVVAKQYKTDRDEKSLIQGLSNIFLPSNHKLFKASCIFFNPAIQKEIKSYLMSRGLYYT